MGDGDMYRLYSLATEQSFPTGELIINQGQAAEFIFNIKAGFAAMYRLSANGKRQVLAFLFPGHFLGFTSDDKYHYSAGAILPVEACCFQRKALESLIEEYPEFDRKLRFALIRAMDTSFEVQFSLGRKNATQKVASFIWYISDRLRQFDLPGYIDYLPMCRTDIADFLGLTIETVSRVFTSLKQSGIICLHGANEIEILDMEQLMLIGDVAVEPARNKCADPEHYFNKGAERG